MKLLHLFISALLIMVMASPGSAKAPTNNWECTAQNGICAVGHCVRPYRSIGRCFGGWNHCCKRHRARSKNATSVLCCSLMSMDKLQDTPGENDAIYRTTVRIQTDGRKPVDGYPGFAY